MERASYQNDKSIITRIETNTRLLTAVVFFLNQNDKSIITRIETYDEERDASAIKNQNDKSIITRIETVCNTHHQAITRMIKMINPS